MEKAFQRIYWENKPSTETPIDANNLNRIEAGVDTIDDRVVTLDSQTSGLTTRVTTAESNITSLQNGKVDKVSGKGLSTNDYTTTEKNKLAGISTQANRTTVTQVQESGDTSKEIAQIGLDDETTSIYADDAKKVIESCYEEKTVTGNPITIKTISGSNAKALTVTMNPIQDLHGYSNPWAGGAGINKLAGLKDGTYEGNGVKAVVKNGVATLSGTTTASGNAIIIPLDKAVTVPNQTCYLHSMNSVQNGSVQPSIEKNGDAPNTAIAFALTPTNRITEIPQARYGVTVDQVRFYLASGVTLSGTFSPMICLTNTATDFAPYENICPISGRTEASVTRTGKNLFSYDELPIINGYFNGSHQFVGTNEVIPKSSANGWQSVKVKVKGYTQITISGMQAQGGVLCEYTADDTMTPISGSSFGSVNKNGTHTVPSNAKWLYLGINNMAGAGSTDYPNAQLELGSTATAYEPYQAETHTKEFGQTVYSGSLNLNSGMLTIDRVLGVLNGTETGYSSVGGSYPQAYRLDNSIFSNGFASNTWTDWAKNSTNKYPAWNTAAGATDYGIRFQNGNANTLFIYDARFQNDLNGFLADLQSNPLQFCYMLATPIELQLSPEVVTLLKGLNVISTDGDNIKLTASQLASITDVINDNVISEGSTFSSSKIDSFTEEKTLDVLDSLTQEITKSGNPIALTTNYGNVLKSCELSMSPIQDLHGYSNPWAGGAGKNKLPMTLAGIKSANTSGTWSVNDYTVNGVTFTIDTDSDDNVIGITANNTASATAVLILAENFSAFSADVILNGCPSGGSNSKYRVDYNGGTGADIGSGVTITAGTSFTNARIRIASGYSASNVKFYPMIRLSTVTDATFAPYSNICPISGRTEVGLQVNHKNILNLYDFFDGASDLYDINSNGTLTVKGRDSARAWTVIPSKTFPAGTYTFSKSPTSGNWEVRVNNSTNYTITESQKFTFTEPTVIQMKCGLNATYPITYQLQVEKGSEATEWVSPFSMDITHQYSETIYGGVDDFVNGGADSTKKYIELDENSNWEVGAGAVWFFIGGDADLPTGTIIDSRLCSNMFKNGYNQDDSIWVIYRQIHIRPNSTIAPSGATAEGLAEFKNWLSTNNYKIQVCVDLATPATISTSAEEITLLKGNNVLSTNADDMGLSYQELPDITSLAQYVQTLEARIKALEEG